ncbi:MAG TPA: ABC transporter ATP-binding protein [Burkholderiaceae bacterium]|nr:ABC transporter ATP-binding protein [Burkholderiaceae bacterium]HQR71410.1 ABC transporter ATP-binding protein [Burkholderiaceae bacterium]
MSGTGIRLERCGKTFADGTRALDPVNLEFAAGETVVLLGPSGCGKTTTLRIVAGLELPDAGGRVLFDGSDVTTVPIERRNVGMVFQSYALFPNMSVEENVAYGLKVRGMPAGEREQRAREMLEMMQIAPLAARSIDQLSGGQRQRVALARALAPRPRVLLLDEPLTALDARLRDTLRVEINRLLRGLGITTVYVTHDQAEAMALGDRIVVMDHGRVAQIGTPRQIYEEPRTRYVAEFIGTMNVVSGEVRADALHFPGGLLPLRNAALGGGSEAMFRPEDLALAASDGSAQFSGEVLASLFQGDHTRLEVDIGAGRPIVARIADRRDFAIGERVSFRLSTPAVRIPAQVS